MSTPPLSPITPPSDRLSANSSTSRLPAQSNRLSANSSTSKLPTQSGTPKSASRISKSTSRISEELLPSSAQSTPAGTPVFNRAKQALSKSTSGIVSTLRQKIFKGGSPSQEGSPSKLPTLDPTRLKVKNLKGELNDTLFSISLPKADKTAGIDAIKTILEKTAEITEGLKTEEKMGPVIKQLYIIYTLAFAANQHLKESRLDTPIENLKKAIDVASFPSIEECREMAPDTVSLFLESRRKEASDAAEKTRIIPLLGFATMLKAIRDPNDDQKKLINTARGDIYDTALNIYNDNSKDSGFATLLAAAMAKYVSTMSFADRQIFTKYRDEYSKK